MPEEYPYSQFTIHEDDNQWVDSGENVYEGMLDELLTDYPDAIDEHASDLLYDGWFNPEISPSERRDAQDEFFEYTEIDYEDFDWDTWREWYDE